jgi:hypothetical protein
MNIETPISKMCPKCVPSFNASQDWLKSPAQALALPHFVGHVDFASNQFLIANTPSHPHSAITLSR